MQLLLEEENFFFTILESQLKEQIETCKKFEHEAEYSNIKKQLQTHLKNTSSTLKKGNTNNIYAIPQTLRNSVHIHLCPIRYKKTEISDSERDISTRGTRQNSRDRGGRGRNKYLKNRVQGRGNFLDPKHPYQLRDQIFPNLNQS